MAPDMDDPVNIETDPETALKVMLGVFSDEDDEPTDDE